MMRIWPRRAETRGILIAVALLGILILVLALARSLQ